MHEEDSPFTTSVLEPFVKVVITEPRDDRIARECFEKHAHAVELRAERVVRILLVVVHKCVIEKSPAKKMAF